MKKKVFRERYDDLIPNQFEIYTEKELVEKVGNEIVERMIKETGAKTIRIKAIKKETTKKKAGK